MFGDLFGDLQKRTGRYLLQRYLGQFLDGKLSLEQLNINLLNGRGTVNNVSLCCKSVNELCEEQGWGVEVTGGHIGQVTVTVPWNALLIDDSSIEVTNLQISLKPKPRETDGASMLESMWSSVSSSMQLAKECLEKEGTGADVNQLNAQNPIEGLEKFAQTIENILKRVKAKFLNTEIRLEYIPPNSNKGIAIIIKIDYLNYQNEACNDPAEDSEGADQDDDNLYSADEGPESGAASKRGQKTHFISSHSTHHITIEGITISTEEYSMDKKGSRKASSCGAPGANGAADDEVSVSSANTSSGIDNTSATSLISSTQFYSVIMTDLPKDQNSFSSGLEDEEVTEEGHVEDDEDKDDETEHESDADDDDNDEECNKRISNKCIPIVRIDGTQEVRVKVKEIQNISGPKVSLDLQIGAVFIFLSPRQIHLLTHFYDVYFNDAPAAHPSHHIQTAPVETEEKVLLGGGWSDPMENYPTRVDPFNSSHSKNFHQNVRHRPYCESLSDSITSTSTTTTTNSSRFHRKAANMDMNGDISSFNVRVASVYAIVLHEEVLFENCGRRVLPPLTEESVSSILEISNSFFSCIEGNIVNDFKCAKNYVRAQVKPIIVDGIQQRNNNNILMKFKVFLTKCDLFEHLNSGRNIVPIVMFDRTENMAGGMMKRPEITLEFKSQTPAAIHASSSRRKMTQPKTEFRILLETCTAELDISIYDRLSAIFAPSPFPQEAQLNYSPMNHKYSQPLVEVKVEAPIFNLNLRFPIADCRPLHDPNRVPWWKQNIRPDFLQVVFYQFRLSVISTVEILGNELDFFYCESESSPKIHIGKSNLVNCANGSGVEIQEEVDYPKITLEFPTNKKLESNIQFIQEGSDSGETSGDGCDLYKHKSKISLPFCSKRVCRESDTPHVKKGMDETETVLLPGDKAELKKFCDRTMKTSKVQIKLHLPFVSLQIHSKHLYETIYNRLNTDLLMWEPSSPIAQSNLKNQENNPISSDQNLYNIGMMDSMYVPPANSTQIDNDIFGASLRDEEISGNSECESDSLYYSTYERKRSRKSQKEPANTINSSLCSFELTISRGMLDFSTPVRDSENRVLPGQYGEFIILADNLKLFSVNGFNGNENLAYLCVQAKNAEIYHCGLLPFREESNRTLRSIDSPIPHFMKSTLYATPKDLTKGEFVNENSKREMLSVVIEIKKNMDQRIKRMKLTVGIQKATLRHHPCLSQHSWLTQIIDFVDVADYPIEGYKPFGIITEMQLHLWDCAIDYRPKALPYRAVLEIGSLLLSSNIISPVTGCTLRFVPEECVLSLAPYDIIKGQQNDNVVSALPSKDLIPVIDIGLFDISLRINDKATESFPKLDLRASIHDIHIRTCSDSGRALAQLILYFASDGDSETPPDKSEMGDEDSSMTTSHTSSIYCEADLLSMRECATSNPEISPEQQERVNQMVADAVQETVRSPSHSSEISDIRYDERGVEVFYFPDETQQFPGEKKFRDISPSAMSTSPSRTNTPHKLQHRSASDEWGFRIRRESESSNELRDLLNFEENVMRRSYMVDNEENIQFGEDDEVVEALPQIREELGEIIHNQKVRFHSDLDDDYCVIGDEERIAMSNCGIKDVKLSEDPLRIVDNHFTPPLGKPDLLKAPENFPMAVMRYTLCEMTVVWHMYGGHDFDDPDSEKDKENIKPKAHMSEAYKHGVSFSKNQNAVTFGKKPMEKVSWKTKGGKNRNHDILIEIQLTKVKLSHEEYPLTTSQASRQVLIVSEIEIRDRLQSSEINKFLHHPTGTFLPNKSSKHMVVIKALHVRPAPHKNPTQECSLRVSLLPMKINIDQDTLLFFVQFFTELTETGNSDFAEKRSSSTSSLQAPIMMVDDLPESLQDLQARKLVNKNIDLLMDDESSTSASIVFAPKEERKDEDKADDSMSSISSNTSDSSPIYFKEVVFSPEVLIRLDYVGRRIEMSRGPIAGLLMGLGQLQCSEIRLKQICHRHGVLGFDKLLNYLFKEWLADIKKNQLPAILRGVGPTYTIVQLFQGIRDLFWLPIEQYQKDGRIVRGLQLGAQSFTARTAFAALEITSRIIQLLQLTAETAFDMVSPGPSSVRSRNRHKKNKKKRLHRPQDIRQGFGNAYTIVKDGINERVNTVIENTIIEHDQKGYTGAAGAIIRQIPPIALAPVVIATQATTNILGGVKNQLVPDAKYEAREKWKDDSD